MIVSVNVAKQRPSEHVFVPGVGYVAAGPLKPLKHQTTIWGSSPKDLCDPPPGVRDQSWHALKPSNAGAAPVTFQWLVNAREWFRLETQGKSRRLGFSPAYLSSHGWRYLGPARNRHG
jgi:hypothetical protein